VFLVWENEKCCGNTSRKRVFPGRFRLVPNFHEYFYNSVETRRKCFLLLLENSLRKITKNKEHLIALFIIKMYILYTAQFTRHKLRHHLVIETRLLTNQRAYFPWAIFQRKTKRAKRFQYLESLAVLPHVSSSRASFIPIQFTSVKVFCFPKVEQSKFKKRKTKNEGSRVCPVAKVLAFPKRFRFYDKND